VLTALNPHVGINVCEYVADWHFHEGWELLEILAGKRVSIEVPRGLPENGDAGHVRAWTQGEYQRARRDAV
jgi:hypothetical protein